MFNSEKVVPEYANLMGWKQHFDNSIVISEDLTESETGEYYQEQHPALRLDLIKATLPITYSINAYLRNVITEATNGIFNDVLQYRQVKNFGKTLLEQSTLLNRYGRLNDVIINQNRFVGFQIKVKSITSLKTVINEVGLQFAGETTFNLYLFHSSVSEPLKVIEVTASGKGAWTWKKHDLELSAFSSEQYHGGVFVLGYYQEDLNTTAINYSNFSWKLGECGTCNNSYFNSWKSIRNYYHIHPIYVPSGGYIKGEMFDLNDAFLSDNESFGLNLKLSVVCDLTDFFIQNKFAFKKLLALKVVYRVLNDMKFSQNINHIEENIKMMIIRDLEGDIDTKLMNIPTQYYVERKSVSFNTSGINSDCLGCESDTYSPTYGVM